MSEVIQYFLDNEPTYAGASPDYVAKELYNLVGSPNGFSEEEFYTDLLKYETPGFTDEFGKGFSRSMEELGVLATKGAGAAALSGLSKSLDYFGTDNALDEKASDLAASAGEDLNDLEKKYPRFREHRSEVDSLESGLQYAGALAGSGLGSSIDILGTALITGGTSAVASGVVKTLGKETLKAAARKAGKELAEDQLEGQLGKAMGKAFTRGAGLGAYAGTASAETGSSYIDMLRDGNDAPGVAIAAGALKGVLEILPEFGVVSRVFKSAPAKEALKEATIKEVFKKFGVNTSKEVVKTGGAEALTEAAQQAIDIAASQFVNGEGINVFTPKGIDQMIEAGLAGFIGGAPLGIVAGAAQTVKPSAVTPPSANVKFKEEDIIESSTPIAEAINPASDKFNRSVADEFNGTPVNTAPVDVSAAMKQLNDKVEGSAKVIKSVEEVRDAIQGPITFSSQFNKEPNLGRLEGINQADIIETDIDLSRIPATESTKKTFTVFNKPVKLGALPSGVSTYTTKPSDYAQQEVQFRNPLEAKTMTEARTILGLQKDASLTKVIEAADNSLYDGVVVGENVYVLPKQGSAPAKVTEKTRPAATIQDITKALNAKTLTYEEAVPQAKALGYNLVKQYKVAAKYTKNNIGREPNWSHRKIPIKVKTQKARPEFRSWFKDSVVVDDSGAPKKMFHGTSQNPPSFGGDAQFFTSDPEYASAAPFTNRGGKGGSVVPVYISAKNPKRVDKNLYDRSPHDQIVSARRAGHDSLIVATPNNPMYFVVTFSPSQVKSVHNKGSWGLDSDIVGSEPISGPGGLRMMNLKTKPTETIKRLNGLLKDIVGPSAKVDFYESINMISADSNMTPLRGAQWSNVIAIALGTNTNLGTSSRETALHEAFHFIYGNVLSTADQNRIENSREALKSYIAKNANLVPYDLDMFDSEELGATAFGIWADKNEAAKEMHTAGRVFKKIKDILTAIKNALRKDNIKTYEDLFEDIVQGKFARDQVNDILNNERLVRAQEVVKNAHRKASDKLISSQSFISPTRVKQMLGKIPDSAGMEYTRWNEFVAKKFNTSPGLAAKDPVWSVVFNILHSKDKNMSIYDAHFSNSMRDLYDNRQRLVNASGVMDHLSDTNQSVKTDDKGRVYYRKGKDVITLNPAVSADVLTLHNGFQDMLKLWRDNALTKLKEVEGYDTVDSAIKDQQDIVSKSRNPNNKLLSAAQLASAKQRLQQLKDLKDTLDTVENRLVSNKAYFPRIANGKYGVTIRLGDKPDEPLRQGFAIVGTDFNGRPSKTELDAVAKRWKEELGYSSDQYVISKPFELNRAKLRRSLGSDSNLNLDILASLLISSNPALADEISESVTGLKSDISKTYINPRFLEQNDLLLYSKDYASVVPSYFSAGVRSVNNYRYSDSMATIKGMLDDGFLHTPDGKIDLTEEQQKLYSDLFEYVSKSSTDMAGWRMFNFMFALGGNISTGVLQLVTLPTFVAGIMNTYSGNPLSNNARIAKNFSKATSMLTDSKFNIDKFGNLDFLEKHLKDKEVAKAVKQAYDRGEFRPARSEDMMGDASFSSGRPGSSGYLNFVKGASKKVLGFPVQTGEEISRIASFISLYETLRDPTALRNFEKNYVDGNHRYETYKDINSDIDPAVYAALFAIDDTHGMFGKLGRGKNQQGVFGALLFPFMQHPLMMMGLMNRLIRGNAVNKQAAAYIMLSTILLAGLYGIPGWELWKETFEMLYKQTTGIDMDLHHEFKEAMAAGGTFSPAMAEGLTEGVLKPLGIDISRRIGMPIFFQDALLPLMQGRGGADQFAGVAGSQVRNIMTNYDKMASGEMNPAEAIFETISPTAFRNLYKAAAVWPQDGVRTAKGNQVMTADEISPQMQLSKALGFQPSQLSREYEKRNVERLQGTGWRMGYDRRIGNLARDIYERNQKEAAGEDTSTLEKNITKQYKELYAFAAKVGKVTDKDFTSSVRTALNKRLANAYYPDVPNREQETVDYGVLDLLYERD